MTIKVFDTFTGTNGTDLSAHTPDTDVVGGGWTDSAANRIELDGSGAAKWAVNGDYSCIDAGVTDMRASTNFTAGGADNRMSVIGRNNGVAGGSRTAYEFNVRPGDSGGNVTLWKVVAGAPTSLATAAYSMNLSSTYLCEILVVGTSIKCYIDSNEVISTTDSAISAGGHGGIAGALRTDANGRFNDFTIDDTLTPTPIFMHHLNQMRAR